MSPPMGHLGMQSRRPVGQHTSSLVANDSPRARRGGASSHPPAQLPWSVPEGTALPRWRCCLLALIPPRSSLLLVFQILARSSGLPAPIPSPDGFDLL